MSPFLDVPIASGAWTFQRVTVGEYADGSPVALPVATARGPQDGPTLYLQGGIHGDELTGVEVCRRAIASIDPATIRGTVIAVPVANVPSHVSRSRGFRHEERWPLDVNRYIPGNAAGLLTERIARVLFAEFVLQADFTIDLHAALDGAIIAPFTYVWPNDDEHGTLEVRRRYAYAFGAPYVYHHDASRTFGTTVAMHGLMPDADRAGVATMIAESGESQRVTEEFVPIGVRGIRNVMIAMGMLDGEPEVPEPPRGFDGFSIVHASRGGGLRTLVELRDEVRPGQPIAEVGDVFGRTVERLEAPVAGFVLRLLRLGAIATGAEVAWIGTSSGSLGSS